MGRPYSMVSNESKGLIQGKSKTIFRIEKTNNYTSIHRYSAEDKRLSWEARGVLIFLLVKPDDWQVCLAHLINSSPAGRDKVRRIIKELMAHNYIVVNKIRGEMGQFSAPEYVVYELPHDGYFDQLIQKAKRPRTGRRARVEPMSEKASPVNPLLLNKQTKPSKQRTNKTTTTNDYIWPPKINKKHQESIRSLMNGVDEASAQLLLDELSGQIENINNPVGYFRTLLKSQHAGEFIPSRALKTQEVRQARNRNAQAIERSHQLSEEKFQLQIKEYEGGNK